MITIDIHYFGMVAEETGLDRESMEVDMGTRSMELKKELNAKYPRLSRIPYRIAVNQEIVDDNFAIRTSCEVALLPAFAGG